MRLYGRNPLDILLEREARTCKGCVHEIEVFGRHGCIKGKKHGKRCRLYVERPAKIEETA